MDGDSEFKAEFEEARKEKGLPLFVPPPRSPKLNEQVERDNETDCHELMTIEPHDACKVSFASLNHKMVT